MPDHLHWMLQLGADGSLSQLVGRMKFSTASQINQRLGHSGQPLWAPAFHDHALRREEDIETVARHIVGNPIRAGLCESMSQYPHWDCIWDG